MNNYTVWRRSVRPPAVGFWSRTAALVMRRPVVVIVVVVGCLAVLGSPFLGLKLGYLDYRVLPPSNHIRQVSVVLLALVSSGISFMKLFGVGLTLAVLMDAFVIRGLLVPAFMRLAAKPDRAIYAAAAQSLGIEPARLLFVGDGSDDELAGAARAGLTPALVESETTDTYDQWRRAVGNWAGTRLRDLSDVLALVL